MHPGVSKLMMINVHAGVCTHPECLLHVYIRPYVLHICINEYLFIAVLVCVSVSTLLYSGIIRSSLSDLINLLGLQLVA